VLIGTITIDWTPVGEAGGSLGSADGSTLIGW
jgi:hypothetical protein